MCGSCHDPHAGGRIPDGSGYVTGDASNSNPRLLRKSITVQSASYTDLYVSFKFESVGTFTYNSVSSGVYRVTAYKSGSTRWCGACHNRFKTGNNNSPPYPGEGHANYYLGMWRHPMDAHPIDPPGFDGSVDTGTPLEKPGSVDHIACLTCHRAHGSTVAKAGWASNWPRDAGGTSTTSALLRMDNRGTCYNCHGAGQYNCWSDNRQVAASGGGTKAMDCSLCHPSSNHFTGGGYACSVCHN